MPVESGLRPYGKVVRMRQKREWEVAVLRQWYGKLKMLAIYQRLSGMVEQMSIFGCLIEMSYFVEKLTEEKSAYNRCWI